MTSLNLNGNNLLHPGLLLGNGTTSVTQEYCLRWNNHQPNLIHYFGSLLNQEAFTDVTLVSSEGRKLACHKAMLSSCSPYFQRVFEDNTCKHPIVILKDVEHADLQTIVNFIYHGEVNVLQDRLSDILKTATSLQIKGLMEVSREDLTEKGLGGNVASRKRDLDKPEAERIILREPGRSLSPSNSWTPTSEEVDEYAAVGDIPRKKVKKSLSATTTSGSSTSTNDGEQSGSNCGSFESGIGVSSKSLDDNTQVNGNVPRSETLVRSNSGPPPLQPLVHLPVKSKSMDHAQSIDMDMETHSGPYEEHHAYDDAANGLHRPEGSGCEVTLSAVETVLEEVEKDEPQEHWDDKNVDQQARDIATTLGLPSSFFASSRQHLDPSGSRRGRILMRQPRIKRPDNDNSGELFISEPVPDARSGHSSDQDDSQPDSESRVDAHTRSKMEERSKSDGDDTIMVPVPIVTVSQCSPTPPSSPVMASKEEETEERLQNTLKKLTTSNSLGSAPSMQSSTRTTLLMVPDVVETGAVSGRGSNQPLVKQHSQPLLPSHTSVLSASSLQVNHMRRQNSQPNPTTHIGAVTSGTKVNRGFVPVYPLGAQKHGTLLQLVSASEGSRSLNSSRDDDGGILSGGMIYLDQKSFIQLAPTSGRDVAHHFALASGATSGKDGKGDLEDSMASVKDDQDSKDGGSSSPSSHDSKAQLQVTQRAGHCPALRPGPALGCNFCWNSVDECNRILRRKTKYHCPECRINLCIVPCFQEYHEQSEKKKPRNKLGLPKPSSM